MSGVSGYQRFFAELKRRRVSGVEGLKVAGRTSSFAFRGQNLDLRMIGDTLGVETVLEGGIRRSEDRVRITAQLRAAAIRRPTRTNRRAEVPPFAPMRPTSILVHV